MTPDVVFAIVEEACHFCGQPKIVAFNEHFVFCPHCTAIYHTLLLHKSNCKHIKDGVPTVVREPRYPVKDGVVYVKEREEYQQDTWYYCSVCHAPCVVDGY